MRARTASFSKFQKLALAAIIVASCTGLAVWLGGSSADEVARESASAERALPPEVLPEAPPTQDTPIATPEPIPQVAVVSQRETVSTPSLAPVLKGQVTTTDGAPIEGAIVTWTAWDPGFGPFVTSSVEIPPARIVAARVVTKTGANGKYFFETPPALAADEYSFVHITHPGRTSATVELDPGKADPDASIETALKAVAPMRVTVFKSGQPASEARVYQQASYPRGSIYGMGVEAPKGRLLFLRIYEANGSGSHAVAGSEYPQKIWAESSELQSRDWVGGSQPEVELELFPCFELSGIVLLPDPLPEDWSVDRFGTATIQVHRVRGPLVEEVASLAVDMDGHFASTRIPLLDAGSYRVSLAGSLFVPINQTIPLPAVGDAVWLELQAEIGYFLWFLARDSDGSPIPNAEVLGRWQVEGQHYEARFPGRPDGYVVVPGLPAGAWEGSIRADGYAPTALGTYVLPETDSFYHIFTLLRGTTLTGRCLAGINPQEDFELRYWIPGLLKHRSKQQVIGSEDGTFVVKDLPGSQVSICAIGPGFERSEIQTVQLSESSESNVTLVLGQAGEMNGRLIDAATGLGIETGRAEVYATHIMYEMDPIGDAVQVTGDGQFSVRRLARGINVVCFRAPGYSSRELKVWFDGSPVDLGDIELTPLHPLTARLSLPEGRDPTQWIMIAKGITTLPPTVFDERGELRIEQCHAGVYLFDVVDVGGSGESLVKQTAWLKEGEPWHLDFNLSEGPSLAITTSGEAPEGQTMWATIIQRSNAKEDWVTRKRTLDKNGEAQFEGLNPGAVIISVRGNSASELAGSELLEVSEDSSGTIVVDVPLRRSITQARIVDSRGNPQSSIRVRLRSTQWPGLDLGGATSNAQGLCVFRAIHADVDRVSISSTMGAIQDDIPFEQPSNPSDIVELVFETDAGLELHIADGEIPQPLATARLRTSDGMITILPGRSPDDAGFLMLDGLGAGKYQLRVTGNDLWPVIMAVEATKGNARYDVDIRRTGDLTLQFQKLSGTPLAAAQIALEFIPWGESVQTWINTGKLHLGQGALITDSHGKITLAGLPHGTYRWSYALHGGEVSVTPGGQVSEEVRLP